MNARKLRIAVWHHLPPGGAKRALFDQVRGLRDLGHQLEAWCPPSVAGGPMSISDFAPEHVVSLGAGSMGRTSAWIFETVGADTAVLKRIAALDDHCRRVADAISQGKFDVVFAASCQWLSVPPLGRYVDAPSVFYLQEPFRRLYEAQPALPWIAEDPSTTMSAGPGQWRRLIGSALRLEPLRRQAAVEAASVRAFDEVLVNSRFSRESARRAYGIDTAVCYLGVDTGQFTAVDADREPFVMSVGRFEPPKNPEFLIRAIGATRAKPKLIWVAPAADRGYVGQMRTLATDLGVTWELREGVEDRELIDLYRRALVFVYAPLLEPFGLAPLEANACGLAAVCVAEGGMRETIVNGENGVVVDGPREMAEALDAFVRDPESARQLGHRAASHVRQHWALPDAIRRLEAHLLAAASLR
jgi:glycosyltransferase involved in cell wall biosynthesis